MSESDLKRLARSKAEFLKLYQWEPESAELREAVERIHTEAAKLGISIDDIDTEAMPIFEKSRFFVHDSIRPPPPVEELLLDDVLLVWRAIWNNGGMQVDNRRYSNGNLRAWEDWSGSPLVKARMEAIRAKGKPRPGYTGMDEAVPHVSFPPGREPETQAEREWADKYGRWVTETDWRQPAWWDCPQLSQTPDHKLSVVGILTCWRGIHANGGLRIDATRYVPGSVPFWAEWSGSPWVKARMDSIEESWSGADELCLHLALPPGWPAEHPDEVERLAKYGRWITETEWEPPLELPSSQPQEGRAPTAVP